MRRALLAIVATVVAAAVLVPAAQAAAPTIVTFTFDDGLDNQMDNAAPALRAHGYPATFYVNSGKVGQPGYMGWADLSRLEADGFEVGGHTTDHRNLVTASPADRTKQVCEDRTALQARGLSVTSFAYPHGGWVIPDGSPYGDRATIPAIVKGCGYQTARTTGGIAHSVAEGCDVCAAPLQDILTRPHNTRAFQISKAVEPDTAQDAIDAIERARAAVAAGQAGPDGGWLQIVLHEVCDADDATCNASTYAMTTGELDAVLDWLQDQPASDCYIVKTTHDVVNPPAAGFSCPTSTPPTVSLTSPADGAVLSGHTTISADAQDDEGVSRVDFYVDDALVGSVTDGPFDVDWDTPATTDGAATIKVIATDADGQTAEATRSVVVDNTAPTVSFLAPASGATLSGHVTLEASAADSSGIGKVEFFAGNQLIGARTAAPYTVDWDTSASSGPVTITARATDANGRSSVTSRTVTVSAPASPGQGGGGGSGGSGGTGGAARTTPSVGAPLAAPSITTLPAPDAAPSPTAETPAAPAPRVRLLAPPPSLLSRGIVRFRPLITAPVGVAKVEYLVNGRVVATTARAPFHLHWRSRSTQARKVRLAVRVIDSAGAAAHDTDITVRVAGTVSRRKGR